MLIEVSQNAGHGIDGGAASMVSPRLFRLVLLALIGDGKRGCYSDGLRGQFPCRAVYDRSAGH